MKPIAATHQDYAAGVAKLAARLLKLAGNRLAVAQWDAYHCWTDV
jgi:hypothetical protein